MRANRRIVARTLLEATVVEAPQEEPEAGFDQTPDGTIAGLADVWVDPRVVAQAKQVIAQYGPEMAPRVRTMNPYDACVQWLDVLTGNGLDTEMYMGNGGHYWLAVGGGIFDPKGVKVVGYPHLTSNSYDAEKIVWRNSHYLDQDVLTEMPRFF